MARRPGGCRLASWSAALIVLTLATAGQTQGVWLIDDGLRVDPVTGELIEARHPAPEGVDAGYRDDNPVWSAEAGRARLLAARNEVVAFQVIVDGGPHRGVSLEVSDLTGPATLESAAVIRRYRQWFVEVRRESAFCEGVSLVTSLGVGWYPDPLIPLDVPVAPGFGQPFDIPDARNAVPGQTAAAFWVDLLVPGGTPPGVYQAVVGVTVDGELIERELELEVLPVTLSGENHAGLGSVNYGGLGFEVWNGAAGAGAEGLLPWFQAAHAHRLEIDALWLWPPGTLPWDRQQPTDWDAWREAMRPFATGEAFTEARGYQGPSPGAPIRRLVLPLESNWPVDHYGWDDPRPVDEAAWQEALVEAEQILADEGWSGLEAHLFINATDEPRDEATFALIRYYGDLVDGAGLADRQGLLFRLDGGTFKSIGELIPGWDTDRIFSEIGDDIDVWNLNGAPAYFDVEAMARRRVEAPGERWWFYSTCSAGEPAIGSPTLEAEALSLRTWGWIVFLYELDGAVTWELDGLRHDIDAATCWTDPTCSGYGINGDALLFYLGEVAGLPGEPIASIRLKAMRRGSQDHEYLRQLVLLDGGRERAEALARDVISRALDDGLSQDGSTGRWSHDPRRWEATRREVGGLLSAEAPPPDEEPSDADLETVAEGDAAGDADQPAAGGSGGCGCRLLGAAPRVSTWRSWTRLFSR